MEEMLELKPAEELLADCQREVLQPWESTLLGSGKGSLDRVALIDGLIRRLERVYVNSAL